MNVTLRGLDRSDIPAWNRLLAAVESVDRTGEHYNEDDLEEEMSNPDIELGQDLVGAFDGDDLVAYFCVYPRSAGEEYHKISLDAATRPDRRGQGIGTLMATAMRDRALAAHAERHPDLPAMLILSGLSSDTAQESLLAGIGLLPERWSFVMRADLGACPEVAPLAGGLRIERYDDSRAEAMKDAHNTAFLDHPNFTPWTDTMWKQWVTDSRSFRPGLSYLVVDPAQDDRIVAYVQTNEYDAYFTATGRREAYVGKVGTLREYRGRGIASTLLGHCLRAYRDAGYDEASLDVDSENPTGALGVYRRAGFEVETRRTDYALTVEPGGLR